MVATRLLLLLALALAAGCSSSDKGYPASAEAAFTSACVAQPSATASGCECTFRALEERLSYEEFRRIDTAVIVGEQLEGDERAAVIDALAECRDESGLTEPVDPSETSPWAESEGDGLRDADAELEAGAYWCGDDVVDYSSAGTLRARLAAAGYAPTELDPPPGASEAFTVGALSGLVAVAVLEDADAARSFHDANATFDSPGARCGNRVYFGISADENTAFPDEELAEITRAAETP